MAYWPSIVELWRNQRDLCEKAKEEQFGKTARQLWGFLKKSYRQLYMDAQNPELQMPNVRGPFREVRIAKAREFVSLMLPYVAARVPTRTVSSRRPPLPAELLSTMQLPPDYGSPPAEELVTAYLLQWYLNYIVGQAGYGAKRQQRTAIPEALVKGRGVVWHEMVEGPSGIMPASLYGSVDHLLIDADCRQWRDAGFIMRENWWQAWRLADHWGIPVDRLRGAYRSAMEKATQKAVPGAISGQSDICKWYEVWSRMGPGHKLYDAEGKLKERHEAVEALGSHVYLAWMEGLDYPLNLPQDRWDVATADEIRAALEWPIAFFEDVSNPFPCTSLDFYPNSEDPWATSPLDGAKSLMVFLDHVYSFLMEHLRVSCKTLTVTSTELNDAVQAAIQSGYHHEMVDSKGAVGEELEKLIHNFQFPEMQKDMWRILPIMDIAFEKSTGMDPLLYGGVSRQMRSATEADVREQHVTHRPEDYADMVEDWNSQIAAKEGQATRLYVGPANVAPLFGEDGPTEEEALDPEIMASFPWGPLSLAWASGVNTDDPRIAAGEYLYETEAGSGRRKNRQKQMADFNTTAQLFMPVIQQFAINGEVKPFNHFIDMLEEVYEVPLSGLHLEPLPLPLMPEQTQTAGKS